MKYADIPDSSDVQALALVNGSNDVVLSFADGKMY